MALNRVTNADKLKGSELERWAAVLLRSVHLGGVVWLGSFVLAQQSVGPLPALLVLCSGLIMLAMDIRAGRIGLREVAGAFVVLKLALVAWMAWDTHQASWLFWLLLIGSSVTSHAPKGFRHWPTKRDPRDQVANAIPPKNQNAANQPRRDHCT